MNVIINTKNDFDTLTVLELSSIDTTDLYDAFRTIADDCQLYDSIKLELKERGEFDNDDKQDFEDDYNRQLSAYFY